MNGILFGRAMNANQLAYSTRVIVSVEVHYSGSRNLISEFLRYVQSQEKPIAIQFLYQSVLRTILRWNLPVDFPLAKSIINCLSQVYEPITRTVSCLKAKSMLPPSPEVYAFTVPNSSLSPCFHRREILAKYPLPASRRTYTNLCSERYPLRLRLGFFHAGRLNLCL